MLRNALLSVLLLVLIPAGQTDVTSISVPTQLKSPLDSFDWRLIIPQGTTGELGYCYYSYLGDRGEMGSGPKRSATISNGAATIKASTIQYSNTWSSSWAGFWFSLYEKNLSRSLVLNMQRALPWPIKSDYQFRCIQWYARVSGTGKWKLELEDPADNQVFVWTNLGAGTIINDIPSALGDIKLLNIVGESNCNLRFHEVGFIVSIPQGLTPLRYAALTSLCQILRCYGTDATGRAFIRDHAQWPIGDFDVVPGFGMVALSVASGEDLGFIDTEDARSVVSACISSFLTLPRYHGGWLPHWLKNGQRHQNSEISTLDTALAYLPLIQAAAMLGLDDECNALVIAAQSLDFESVTIINSLDGTKQLSMGFTQSDTQIPYCWNAWGGETQILEVLGYLRDVPYTFEHANIPPVYAGRGFIMELAALEFSEFDGSQEFTDAHGVNWYTERVRHMKKQQNAFSGCKLFGLSSVEVISRLGATRYLEGGIGDHKERRFDGWSGATWGRPWIAPHCMAMIASLNPGAASTRIRAMIRLGLMPPLSGPAESVLYRDGKVVRSHSVRTALNAYFNTLGYYHAVVKDEGITDKVYAINQEVPALKAALDRLMAR